jgi:hypothetical protein
MAIDGEEEPGAVIRTEVAGAARRVREEEGVGAAPAAEGAGEGKPMLAVNFREEEPRERGRQRRCRGLGLRERHAPGAAGAAHVEAVDLARDAADDFAGRVASCSCHRRVASCSLRRVAGRPGDLLPTSPGLPEKREVRERRERRGEERVAQTWVPR